MAQVELIMPKMGESIIEATIQKWVKKVGDPIEMDETILEISTDKIDSEVPSPFNGVLTEILFQESETVEVGQPIAIITTELEDLELSASSVESEISVVQDNENGLIESEMPVMAHAVGTLATTKTEQIGHKLERSSRFYSPLVKNIAKKEGISLSDLDKLEGTGKKGRVTKNDLLKYLSDRKADVGGTPLFQPEASTLASASISAKSASGEVEIIEMDRIRQLIAEHMVTSKKTSAHVTSFVEADVTNIVNWRNKVKADFEHKYSEKITYTPIFIEAIIKAIRDFPMVNISLEGNKILLKKAINIGMATALPSGNLIVPVIKNADHMSLIGLTKSVNDLAKRARANKLLPAEIQDGTFTLTNVGTFGNVMGTPIINQPQVAIMATGAIRKKPAVLETSYGDVIAIRHMMFLSLSYDHRVVDGYLGGSFLRKVGDYLETFDITRAI